MNYNIFGNTAPAMPRPAKGTEIVKILASQASRDMREPLIPMSIPALAAHLSGVEFMYSDNKYYELCGQMGHLIGPSGVGKAQFTHLVEAIMRPFREHDEAEYRRLADWQRLVKTRGANKEKPERPEVGFWFPPADLTNPAFIQNAMVLEKAGGRTQYLNLPEVEMADKMCGGHRQVSQTVRNIYDRQRAGALRATAGGVTGNPVMRVNITFSSTPDAARAFYRKDLTNGFFGRIPFAYKARGERKGRIPRQGAYGGEFLERLDDYIVRLDSCRGRFVVRPLNKVADQLAEEMAQVADLADGDMLFELSHRSILGMEEGCRAVDTERADVGALDRRLRGVVLLLRPVVEGKGLRRHVQGCRRADGRRAEERSEEHARQPRQPVQRAAARKPAHAARQEP